MEVPIRSNTLEQLKYQLRCKNLQELFRKTSLPFFVVIVLTVCWSSDKECDHLLTLINKETGLVIGDVKNLPMFYCNTCGNICQHVSAWFFPLPFSSYYFYQFFFSFPILFPFPCSEASMNSPAFKKYYSLSISDPSEQLILKVT